MSDVLVEKRADFAVAQHRRIEVHVNDSMGRIGGHAQNAAVIGKLMIGVFRVKAGWT